MLIGFAIHRLFDFINSVLISDDVLKCSRSSEKFILFCQHACRHLESLLLFQLSFLRSYIIGKVYIGSPSQLVSNTNETSLHPNFFPQVFTQDSSQYSDQLSCKTENSTTTFNLINFNLLEWPRFFKFSTQEVLSWGTWNCFDIDNKNAFVEHESKRTKQFQEPHENATYGEKVINLGHSDKI